MNATKTSEKSDRNLMDNQQALREAGRAQANRDELADRIARAIRHDGTIEPLKGLHFNRYEKFTVSNKSYFHNTYNQCDRVGNMEYGGNFN